MPRTLGNGKFKALASKICEDQGAELVVVFVYKGAKGSGFASAGSSRHEAADVADLLARRVIDPLQRM